MAHPARKTTDPDSQEADPRRLQLMVGLGILAVLVLCVPSFYIIWHFVPGVFGEFLGVLAGIISTPFLLEASFLVIGLVIVIALNNMRLRRDGDEYVYLEEVDDPHALAGLPARSSFAIYKDRPLDGEAPALSDSIEGAIEAGDYAQAADWLAALDDAQLRQPACLALRIRLARATGKDDLARRLEGELNPPAAE